MNLFERIPAELFSVLASPNRGLYADALDVLYEAYRENLKIPEDTLYSMLRSKLEAQLADATFEGEDIDEEELKDISGRARFLIRKLYSKGWFEKERGEDFDEYITVPGYSSRLLEVFHQLRDDSPVRGYSYVFGTYSTLKVAADSGNIYDKMAAVYGAYDNTRALINLLQMVYHNVKHFFQMQIKMQEVNDVLASHFDEFGQKVVEAYIRPLKIKDSVPKYRVPIQTILTGWIQDEALLLALSNTALQDRRGTTLEECRSDLLQKIFWVKDCYDSIEHDYLDEIDRQVRRYTRATTQKLENLTNRDYNVRGNLNYLLAALGRKHRTSELVDRIQPVFQYLNTQKFYLLVKPVYYQAAVKLYDRIKQDFGQNSFGIVDVGKLREQEKSAPQENSLAQKVETQNDLARSYIDYLLGRVTCCARVEELRKHKVAITAEGMLYQGYVVRPLRRALMDDAFIGRRAVQLRIQRLEEELAQTENTIEYWTPILKVLKQPWEPVFTQFFVQTAVQEKLGDYLHVLEIKKKINEIEEQISNLNLFWLEEQRRNIGYLREEIDSLRSQHKNTVERQGQLKEQIRQLEYERLPALYQELSSLEDALNEEFSQEYQEKVGIPRYEQELYRLKRAAVIQKNFSDQLIRTKNEMGLAERNLFQARREYADRFKPCPFRVDAADNEEYEAEQRTLEESELPKYREKIKAARESALEQFQNDFLSKLKSSIDQVQEQVKNLNKALKQAKFGTDQYQFKAERNPDYADYYDMIMAPELMEGEGGLFALPFQQKYGKLIETMFSQIAMSDDTQANSRKQSELLQNIERFTDFRTYLKFDLETTDQNGSKQLLSQTLNTKSGGETQTPFYIAVLASFAQLYQVNNPSILASNTMRLIVFDEAFNKMDSDRIIESVRLLRKMGLQAIICTPPDKLPDIMPLADRTHLVIKEKYQMHTKAWGKEILPA